MKVHQLIAALQQLPPEHDVVMHWDGEPRSDVEVVWENQGGSVSIGWLSEPVYSDEGRSIGAPKEEPGKYLAVEDMPNIIKGE